MIRAALLCPLLLLGCSAPLDPGPTVLTTEQAERLALVRFGLYSKGVVTMSIRVPNPAGDLLLDGRADLRSHLGMAALRVDGNSSAGSLLQWNLAGLCSMQPWDSDQAPAATPDGRWNPRMLQRTGSNLDSALLLALNLGSDRPENAQLLQQSTARRLRTDAVAGVEVDVFTGPTPTGPQAKVDAEPRLRYWVDRYGELHRFEARLGESTRWMRLDLTAQPAPAPITAAPTLPAA